jgi:anti-anti-sigma regulatory factor
MRVGDHAWFPAGTADERAHVIGTFVTDGVAAGEKIVMVGEPPPWTPPAGHGPTDRRARAGQVRLLPRDQACLTGGRFNPDRLFATLDREVACGVGAGYPAVRLVTDLGWVLDESDGAVLLLAYEDRLAAALAVSTVAMAICPMDRRSHDDGRLPLLRDRHQVLVSANPVFDDGTLRITPTFAPPGLRLEGEIDPSHRDVLSRALSAATAGHHPVHLDLGGLRFIELGALSLLAAYGTRLPSGRHLVLDDLRPDVRALFEMLGWHRMPGIARGREARISPDEPPDAPEPR